MATRAEVAAVYGAGMVQGVALVTFPAASTIFTSSKYYGLSSSTYGAMFLPQAIAAIGASLLGAGFARRWGRKRVLLIGLVADLLAMLILLISRYVMDEQTLAYVLLLGATASLGVGFGLTVPSLNSFAADFFPRAIDRAVLLLNALLGVGTVLAPVFVAVFVSLGYWQGLPIVVALLLAGLIVFSLRLPLVAGSPAVVTQPGASRSALPQRFWIFAAFAVLYGIAETLNGNWASLYMTNQVSASTTQASLALTAFWGMVTVGRIGFALVERWLPERNTYHLLTLVLVIAFLALSFVAGSPAGGIVAFGIAGLGCSALLPLTISFGEKDMPVAAAAVAGGLIAAYQVGYGVAAFGVGPLQELTGMDLAQVYGWSTLIAVGLTAVSFLVRGMGRSAGTETAPAPRHQRRANPR